MKKIDWKISNDLFALLLTIPAVVITVAFIFIPIVDSVIESFLQYGVKNIITGKPGIWNNFHNYIRLFKTSTISSACIVTLRFVLFVVIFQLALGMALALILNSNIKCSRFIRSIMMAPWVVPTVISGLIWMWIFQPQYGIMKYIVAIVGGNKSFAVLNDPKTALTGVSVAALWKQIPLMTLLLLAGLQNVPSEIMEAATIDGAGVVAKFFHVTIPYLNPVIKIAVAMSIIENFKQFPLFWTMTGGGPNGATTNFSVLSYREAFVSMNLGSGAAVTTIWMIMMIIIIGLYNHFYKVDDLS
ncbi:MAG: sugar ABC transporter permease [Treponema sp.]|jgi:multiple sugar transport system permease protein|nr:sugar ABC transporter permease [Treponema sp.]